MEGIEIPWLSHRTKVEGEISDAEERKWRKDGHLKLCSQLLRVTSPVTMDT